jgi:hypothetical protein
MSQMRKTFEVIQDALTIYGEAVQLVKEHKSSRGIFILEAKDGSFEECLLHPEVPETYKKALRSMRSSLIEFTNAGGCPIEHGFVIPKVL